MNNTNRIARQRSFRLDPLGMALCAVFIVLATITAIYAFRFIRDFVSKWSITDIPGVPVTSGNDGSSNAGSVYVAPIQPGDTEPKVWDGKSRINVLFFGLDYRECDATHNYEECDTNENSRTDSMILFTLDPITMTAGMLSIPRDLWVNIPGFDYGKINTAYYLGASYNLPGGGPQATMDTVSEFLGVNIDYFVQINFDAFVRLIDDIGGVKVTPTMDVKIEDPSDVIYYLSNPATGKGKPWDEACNAQIANGGTTCRLCVIENNTKQCTNYNVVKMSKQYTLKAGETVVLTGEMALSYARNRYTAGGDFDRAQRQQQVIMAIRNQLMRFDSILKNAPTIYAEISSGVKTNLTLDQALQLAALVLQIPDGNIVKAAITPDQLIESRSPDGLDIYLPIPEEIRLVRDAIFTTGGTTSPLGADQDITTKLQGEGARVAVLNGSYAGGLDETTQSYLQSQGINVVQTGNADQALDTCRIILFTAKPYTLSYLASLFGVDSNRIENRYDPNAQVDITVILGNSWASSNPMQ
jgi:LCP family protein required for cell wall assembly